MREIKFRGYSKNYNTMFDYEDLKDSSDGMVKICQMYLDANEIDSIPIEKGLFIPTEDEDMSLVQYTGLKDKNGEEIYEGGILFTEYTGVEAVYSEVIFKDGMFMSKEKGCKYPDLLVDIAKDCKVIGNMHDDPSLLEGKEWMKKI